MPDEEIPEKLYKYYPFNQRSLEVFINKQVYFSSPDQFNDPFDSIIKIKFELSRKEYNNIMIPFDERYREMPDNGIVGLNKTAENKSKEVKKVLECQRNAGVYCLSLKNNNILMWSHYASNHKGFCIEFTDVQQYINKTIFKVKYEKEYPDVNFVKEFFTEYVNNEELRKSSDSSKILVKTYIEVMTTKFELWEYEKEYRKINPEKGLRAFKPEVITSVIFGWKMEEAERKTIVNLLKHDEWSHVKLKEAVPIEGKFALRIKDYQP